MKNLLVKMQLSTIFFSVTLFVNCSSQSNISRTKPANPLIGHWEYVSTARDQFQQRAYPFDWIDIKEDGLCREKESFYSSMRGNEYDCHWKASGNELIITTWDDKERRYTLEDGTGGKKILVNQNERGFLEKR